MNTTKAWLYAAVATVALAGAAPAYAVTTVNGAEGSVIPFAEGNGSFANPNVPAGVFTDVFTFNVTQAGYLTALSSTSSGTTDNNDIEGFTLTLAGPGGFTPVTANDTGSGFFAVASTGNTLLTQLGGYTLTVSGNAGSSGSSYGGSYSFSSTAVPGPIAGAGLPALLALGGFVWARRRKATAVA